MAYDKGIAEWAREALEPVGTVTVRPMMGVATLYCDGTIFAVVDEAGIWFKADAVSDALWDAAGCERITLTISDGKTGSPNYRRAPDQVYDDPDAMREWAAHAIAAGQRAPKKKSRKRRA